MEVIGAQKGFDHATKVYLVKARLRALFRTPGRHYRLNTHEPVEIGLAYSDRAIDAGELLYALGRCTPRQQQALRLWLDRGNPSQEQIARRLHVSLTTVKCDIRAAFETMLASIWNELPGS